MNSTWEQKVEVARAKRMARAREFAARRGMSRQAGEHFVAAVDAEPGLNLSLIDQFPPRMREAAAAILPRAAHGPDHEPAARDHLATATRMASTGRHREAARWLAEAGREVARADERRMRAEELRADERAQAARSVKRPRQAAPGDPCGPSGDHLARYLRAEQCGAITRDSLTEVIASLDVIAPQVTIRPPGDKRHAPLTPRRRIRFSVRGSTRGCAALASRRRPRRCSPGASNTPSQRSARPTAAVTRQPTTPASGAGAGDRSMTARHPSSGGHPARTPVDLGDAPRSPYAAHRAVPPTRDHRQSRGRPGRSDMSDTIHRMVTERMIGALERDTVPWQNPGTSRMGGPRR